MPAFKHCRRKAANISLPQLSFSSNYHILLSEYLKDDTKEKEKKKKKEKWRRNTKSRARAWHRGMQKSKTRQAHLQRIKHRLSSHSAGSTASWPSGSCSPWYLGFSWATLSLKSVRVLQKGKFAEVSIPIGMLNQEQVLQYQSFWD
jgi:hypothetical protein